MLLLLLLLAGDGVATQEVLLLQGIENRSTVISEKRVQNAQR